MARIEVILQPEQSHLQEKVMELSNDAQHVMPKNMEKCMRISLPANVDTQRLDKLGVDYKQVSSARGPKRKFGERERTTVELSRNLLKASISLRGEDSLSVWIEKALRRDPEIAAQLKEMGDQGFPEIGAKSP